MLARESAVGLREQARSFYEGVFVKPHALVGSFVSLGCGATIKVRNTEPLGSLRRGRILWLPALQGSACRAFALAVRIGQRSKCVHLGVLDLEAGRNGAGNFLHDREAYRVAPRYTFKSSNFGLRGLCVRQRCREDFVNDLGLMLMSQQDGVTQPAAACPRAGPVRVVEPMTDPAVQGTSRIQACRLLASSVTWCSNVWNDHRSPMACRKSCWPVCGASPSRGGSLSRLVGNE